MKKMQKYKLNNEGSTLVFVVVALLFIGLLATLILALSVAGYRMKTVDYQSRQNFYEGEEYSGKIYADLGMNATGILGEAYVKLVGQLNTGNINGQTELNDMLKETYYKNMMLYLKLTTKDTPATTYATEYTLSKSDTNQKTIIEGVETYLQNVIDRPGKYYDETGALVTSTPDPDKVPKVVINGDIVCNPQGGTSDDGKKYPTIVMNDVHLSYVDKEKGYESNYTFDIVIRYPEWDFTYSNPINASTDVDTFLDYVFISNGALVFDSGYGSKAVVNGGVATGTNTVAASNDTDESKGIYIKNSNVEFNENTSNWYDKLSVVATDNIYIVSSAGSNSAMTINGGQLWCNSIILDREPTISYTDTNGSRYSSSNGTKMYIQDDLQLDGENSTVNINGGSYFGYSSITSDQDDAAYNSSSAIMINGNNSSVNITNLDQFFLYGLAYLNLKNKGTSYRTGESLTVRSNQDLYLVPDELLPDDIAVNPTSKAMNADQKALVAANLWNEDKFFGAKWLVANDPSTSDDYPFIEKVYEINNKEYTFYYLRFSTPMAQSTYVQHVLTSTDNNVIRQNIKTRVLENLADVNPNGGDILSLSMNGGSGFSVGALVYGIKGGATEGSIANVETAQLGDLVSVNTYGVSYRNQFRLMKSLLISVDQSKHSNNIMGFNDLYCNDLKDLTGDIGKKKKFPERFGSLGETRDVDNLALQRSMVANFIDTARLNMYVNNAGSNEGGARVLTLNTSHGTIKYVVGDYTVGNFTGVMVVDGNVKVNGNVNGLIISTKKITVTSSGTYQSNPGLVNSIMMWEQEESNHTAEGDYARSDVFYFYPVVDSKPLDTKTINQLQYSDVVFYDNWRRYEDK